MITKNKFIKYCKNQGIQLKKNKKGKILPEVFLDVGNQDFFIFIEIEFKRRNKKFHIKIYPDWRFGDIEFDLKFNSIDDLEIFLDYNWIKELEKIEKQIEKQISDNKNKIQEDIKFIQKQRK